MDDVYGKNSPRAIPNLSAQPELEEKKAVKWKR